MKNFFELFSLHADFFVDQSELEKKYLEFQNQFHPDKSQGEKGSDDISQSIKINAAYKILSDDFLRACYILKLNGTDIQNDERAVKVDLATLERVLELQEKIAGLVDKNEIEELREKLNAEIKFLIAASVKCFGGADIELAAQFLVKAKYLKKSAEDLKIRKQKI
jgi:molecular chaperone HscB